MLAALHVDRHLETGAGAGGSGLTGPIRRPATSPDARGPDRTDRPWLVGGPVEGVAAPAHYDFRALRMTPAEVRAEFDPARVVAGGGLPDRRGSCTGPRSRPPGGVPSGRGQPAHPGLAPARRTATTTPGSAAYQAVLPRVPAGTAPCCRCCRWPAARRGPGGPVGGHHRQEPWLRAVLVGSEAGPPDRGCSPDGPAGPPTPRPPGSHEVGVEVVRLPRWAMSPAARRTWPRTRRRRRICDTDLGGSWLGAGTCPTVQLPRRGG